MPLGWKTKNRGKLNYAYGKFVLATSGKWFPALAKVFRCECLVRWALHVGRITMRQLLLATTFIFSFTCVAAASPIAPQLVGIWATDSSEFRNEALMKGQALYLDTDGIGAFVGGDGRAVIGVRMVITSYNPTSYVLTFNLTEQGKVITNGALTYDPAQEVIFSPKDPKQRYQHRATTVSSEIRKSLSLEPRKP